jgi:5'-3' exonuclease
VRGDRVVLWDRRRETVTGEAGVREKFGVSPASIPDYLALVGDAADGIPGIPRWGKKSAATVLAAFEHLDAIPDDPESWTVTVRGAPALAKELAARRDEAELYRTLATLRTDVPLGEDLRCLRYDGPDGSELEALAEEIGATDLVGRVPGAREG